MSTNDVNLLLKMKKFNERYIHFLNELIYALENINSDTCDELTYLYAEFNIFEEKSAVLNNKLLYNKFFCLKQIDDLLNKKILNHCNHEFIEDYIDITPDKSEKIVYCKICENNLDDCNKKN